MIVNKDLGQRVPDRRQGDDRRHEVTLVRRHLEQRRPLLLDHEHHEGVLGPMQQNVFDLTDGFRSNLIK